MAGKWQDFQANKDLYPNLKYVTAGDARVREKHKQWDGLILPIDHPWWNTHFPPNDWGCRCNVVQTDEEVTPNIPSLEQKTGFENNPGKTGMIFKGNAYQQTLTKQARKEAKENLSEFLQDENNLIKTANDRVKISLGADRQDLYRNYQVAKICADKLDIDFLIRTHREIDNFTNPEYLINGKHLGDRKSIESINNMRKVIDEAKKQMLNIKANPNQIPYYIVWDLDKVEIIDLDEIIRTLQRKITAKRGKNIKAMIFHYKGKAVELTREEILKRDFSKLKELK